MRIRWADLRDVAAPLGVLAATVVLDVLLPPHVAVTTGFAVAGLVAAATTTVPRTAAVAAAATLMAGVSAAWNQDFESVDWWKRLALAAVFGGLAVYLAALRTQRERALQHMTLVAETAQHALLRALPSEIRAMRFAARYESATAAASVGGDLYEVADTLRGVRVIIGDVRGKGLEAVHMASTVLAAFRRAAYLELTLEAVAVNLDVAVTSVAGDEDFVTALLVEFHDDGSAAIVNLGHPAPLLITGPTAIGLLLHTGEPAPPLGLGPVPTSTTVNWPPGARMLLYTDGLIEARDRSRTFFPLQDHVEALRRGDLDKALDNLLACLNHHVAHRRDDDVALILAEHADLLSPVAGP